MSSPLSLDVLLKRYDTKPDGARFYNPQQLEQLLKVIRQRIGVVCQVQTSTDKGTGCLIGGNLLITNHHVIPDKETAAKSHALFFRVISQDADKNRTTVQIVRLRIDPSRYFCSSPDKKEKDVVLAADAEHLDFTIVALEPDPYLEEVKDRVFSIFNTIEPEIKALSCILQHPDVIDSTTALRGDLKWAIGLVHKREDCSIHYDTETAPGSSGGVVMNERGDLIALHYQGLDNCGCDARHPYCNAGVLMTEIVQHLERKSERARIVQRIKTYEIDEVAMRQAALQKISNSPGFPAQPFHRDPIKKIPIPAPHVVPRTKPLDHIHAQFDSAEPNVCYRKIVAIVGNPAEGKTELTKQYANKYRDQYHHVWFVQCESWEKEYRNLAWQQKLFPSEAEAQSSNIENIICAVHKLFDLPKTRSLIIFDNAPADFISEKLQCQPPPYTDILVTSRAHWPEISIYLSEETLSLTDKESFEILSQWIDKGRFNPDEAKRIIYRLGRLPAVLAQAGYYIDKNKIKMEAYLPIFEKRMGKTLIAGKWRGQAVDIVTFLNIENLKSPALQLLVYCCGLPGKNIPTSLLCKLLQVDLGELNEHLSDLGTFVIRENEGVTIHDLFQEIILEKMPLSEKQLSRLGFVCTACKEFSDFLMTNPSKAVPIFQQGIKDFEKKDNKEKISDINVYLGKCCQILGDHPEAIRHYQEALKIPYTDRKKLAAILNLTGSTVAEAGEYQKASRYIEMALQIRKAIADEMPGDAGNDLAESYNTFSINLRNLKYYSEALNYALKSLDIRMRTLPQNHPDLAVSHRTVALSLRDGGADEEALKHARIALEIRKKALPQDHPDIGGSYGTVGSCLRALAKKDKAREKEYLDEAKKSILSGLEIRKKASPPNPHLVAWSCYNLSLCLSDLKSYSEALSYAKEALEIWKKKIGWEKHPDLTRSYRRVALCHRDVALYDNHLSQDNKEKNLRLALENIKDALMIIASRDHDEQDEEYLKDFMTIIEKQSDMEFVKKIKEVVLPYCIKKFGNELMLIFQ